jgi:preprotein translocase subunit YajC
MDMSTLQTFAPLVLIFAIFYFLIIRPQQQRAKQHREMVSNVRRGDTVVTAGGLIGRVVKVKDEGEVLVEIADNVQVRVLQATISEVRAKGSDTDKS